MNLENEFMISSEELGKIIDKTKFDPPQSMIDNYRSYLVEDYKSKNPDCNIVFPFFLQ